MQRAATAAFKSPTLPGRLNKFSASVVMVVTKLLGSGLTGKLLTTLRSAAEMVATAAWSAAKLVRSPMLANLVGLMELRSWRTPKVGTASWTTGSWKIKLGTTPFRTLMMLEVMLPRPFPPGRAIVFAIEPTRLVRSGIPASLHVSFKIREGDERGDANW